MRRHRGTVRARTRRGDRAAAASRGWPRWRRAAAAAAARHTCNLCWGRLASGAGVEGLIVFIPGHQLPPLLPVRGRGGFNGRNGVGRSTLREAFGPSGVGRCGLAHVGGWGHSRRGKDGLRKLEVRLLLPCERRSHELPPHRRQRLARPGCAGLAPAIQRRADAAHVGQPLP
eukprot:COSAG01_NODE_5378_length_4297_cov_3.601953_1_plen_172_part_00